MPVDLQRARDLFLHVVGKLPHDQWDAHVANACSGDVELRQYVLHMLDVHREAGSFLEQPAPGTSAFTAAVESNDGGDSAGSLIGPYKLIEQIGEGGMGTVWMAQQTEPVKRVVALKLIKAGMDSKQVIARFEAERQALALMDHVNIARVLDAGTSSAGRPFFVMDLVKGVPITRYCDEHRLTPRERLELFIPVCQAVQHAHQKGIIHRDLKPSNVLVALYDGKPVPKVIDFGVAKAAGPTLTEKTLVTGFGAIVGTLEYMSPEQAEINQLDIDTRSDIYSLGVLLYELLTGSPPFTRKELEKPGMIEMLRVIREEEPTKPSMKLSTAQGLPTLAANRGTDPGKLTKLVRGELDWIVMKCLEKDRSRRYETANGFAQDIERYLADEPVLAGPPSAWYRLRKFARRNKGPVLAATVIVLLLIAGITGATTGWVEALLAEKETARALKEVSTEQTRTKAALALVTKEQTKTKAALVQVTAEQTKTQTALTSANDALDALTDDVVKTMFTKQLELDEKEKAFLRKVIGFYETVTQQMGNTLEAKQVRAHGYFKVAYLRSLLGEKTKAAKEYQQAVALLEPLSKEAPKAFAYRDSLASSYHNLGILLTDLGNPTEGEAYFRKSVALHEQLAKDVPEKKSIYEFDLAANLVNLAVHFKDQKKYKDAEESSRRAIELLEQLEEKEKAEPGIARLLARARSNHGQLFRLKGEFAKAEEYYQRAMDVQRRHLADFPSAPTLRRDLADSCNGMGIVCAELRKEAEAEAAFREGLNHRKKLADDYPKVLHCRHELAGSYQDLGFFFDRLNRFADARPAYMKAVSLRRTLVAEAGDVPRYRRELAHSLDHLGNIEWEENRLNVSEAAWLEELELIEKLIAEAPKVADYHDTKVTTLGRLATLENKKMNFTAALALMKKARPHLDIALAAEPKIPTSRLGYRNLLLTLAQSHLGLGQYAEAAALADELSGCGCEPTVDALIAAGMFCSCAMIVGKNEVLSDDKRTLLSQTYVDRALAQLRQSINRGFRDANALKQHPDFRLLRGRAEFQKLIAELEQKAKK